MTDNEDFTTGMVGRRALSKEGHAAISMRGGDDRWIQIQKNTFTNWVNEQLREKETRVEDLQFDFMDGTKLCYLVESLQGKRIKGKVVQNPQNQHQMLHNAGMALTAIADDNVKLVNIGPEDIVNGNLKLILGLIWHLILRYQIGKTKFPPKKLMLAWLQAVIPECQVGNFTRDWNDGVALHALLDYCKPGLAPDWRQLNRNNKVENCRNAMQLAKQHFDIPLVLRPEDLSSPDLDELSGMTYLSYYMKYDSPGYRATLNWVRNAIPDAGVNNFTTDWNDGQALCKLVRKMGGSSPANPHGTPVENLQAGIDAGKRLGVDPILSAKELSEASEEHLGMMAYAASFNHLKPGKPPAEKVALNGDFNNVMVGNEKNFGLQIQDDKVRSGDIRAVLEGPNSRIPVRLDWRGNAVEGHFKPKEAGRHETPAADPRKNAERCKQYREKMKLNSGFREAEKLRKRLSRAAKTDEQKAHDRELARLRMAKKRKAEKEVNPVKVKPGQSACTRKQTTELRKKWKESKRKYRANLGAQKKRRIREKDRVRKREATASFKADVNPSNDGPYTTPEARRKAISRARQAFPKTARKFSAVLHGIITSAARTPVKRKMLDEEGIILTPNKRQRLDFLESTMDTFKEFYKKLKISRKAKDTKQRRILGHHISRMKKYRRQCSKELGIRWGTLLKWSTLSEDGQDILRRRRNAISTTEEKKVQDFFIKPYISYTHSGKKAVLKRLQKQRQTMTRTLRGAYDIFMQENPNTKMSYSKFTKLRPKNVQTQDRGKFFTCLCEKCINVEMKIRVVNTHRSSNPLGNKYDVTRMTLCDHPKGSLPHLKCSKRQCNKCGIQQLKQKLSSELESSKTVVWLQWASCKIIDDKTGTVKNRKVLEQNEGELKLLTQKLIDDMEEFSYHLFCATWQHKQFSIMRESPEAGQVIAVLDFAENYTCHFQDECQSAHWCKKQITIHPVVCYYQEENKTKTQEIVFVSEDLKHDAHVVHAISKQTLQILERGGVDVRKMVQFTDGCGSQYKSKIPFLDISHANKDFVVDFERHYFGSGHGKGPADGCSGVVKAAVTRAVKGGSTIVRNVEEFFNFCCSNLEKETDEFKRSFHMLAKNDIKRARPDRTCATTVEGTRKIHCVRPVKPGIIETRELSCACTFCRVGCGNGCLQTDVADEWETKAVTVAAGKEIKKPAKAAPKKQEKRSCKSKVSLRTVARRPLKDGSPKTLQTTSAPQGAANFSIQDSSPAEPECYTPLDLIDSPSTTQDPLLLVMDLFPELVDSEPVQVSSLERWKQLLTTLNFPVFSSSSWLPLRRTGKFYTTGRRLRTEALSLKKTSSTFWGHPFWTLTVAPTGYNTSNLFEFRIQLIHVI